MHFSWSWRAAKIMSEVPRPARKPHWLSGRRPCSRWSSKRLSRTRARILPAMDRRDIPLWIFPVTNGVAGCGEAVHLHLHLMLKKTMRLLLVTRLHVSLCYHRLHVFRPLLHPFTCQSSRPWQPVTRFMFPAHTTGYMSSHAYLLLLVFPRLPLVSRLHICRPYH